MFVVSGLGFKCKRSRTFMLFIEPGPYILAYQLVFDIYISDLTQF